MCLIPSKKKSANPETARDWEAAATKTENSFSRALRSRSPRLSPDTVPNRHELSMAEGQSPNNARRDGERAGRQSNVAQLKSNIIVHVPLDPFEFRRKRFSAVLQTQDLIRE